MSGILEGIRILDTGGATAGTCALMLALQGAEVIRIGHPDGPPPDPALDRGKRSVTLDLGTDEGTEAFRTLAASAAVIAGPLPESLGYEALAALNPRLVHGTARNDSADGTDAAALAFAIMAALRQAEATGRGQAVSLGADGVPLFSAMPAPEPPIAPKPGADTDRYLAEMPEISVSDADKRALRDAFGSFATGVTVLTALQADGTPRGFTANSFTSVSLDPPLLLVCIGKSAHSIETFAAAPHFAVNVLREDQKDVSQLFASRDPDKFAKTAWRAGAGGAPVIENALASLSCRRERMIDAGDHVILLGRVIDHASGPGTPLGFFRGAYLPVLVQDELVSAATEAGRVEVGGLIARGPQLLLTVASDGSISVPKAPEGEESQEGVLRSLERTGLRVEMGLLYAVYRDSATGKHVICYRGTASGNAPRGHKFIHDAEIPFGKIRNAAERSMIRRYAAERRAGSFGIYEGDETRGTVHRVVGAETSKH